MDLFDAAADAPLAERARPRKLSEVIGQPHLVGPQGQLSRWIAAGVLPSIIFWGPPGTGKTTMARLLARELNRPFQSLNATHSGVRELRALLDEVSYPRPVLFIDEIHRFNKSQQDALLPAVEAGKVTLVGATTENPSFEVNSALLSRSQVLVLKALSEDDVRRVVERAFEVDKQMMKRGLELRSSAALYRLSGGDARRALNLVELVAAQASEGPVVIDDEAVQEAAQSRVALYDKHGEQHYDLASALIKSIRGGDPNAGVYWLARMLAGGEDPLFIARRLVVLASEDIGNANPTAAVLANACFDSVHRIGMPECRIVLAQTVAYLAASPKSNAAYQAIEAAWAEVERTGDLPVPLHLRNAPTRLMKNLDYGKGYKYTHDQQGLDKQQEYLPDGLSGTVFYRPRAEGREKELLEWLRRFWQGHYPY